MLHNHFLQKSIILMQGEEGQVYFGTRLPRFELSDYGCFKGFYIVCSFCQCKTTVKI